MAWPLTRTAPLGCGAVRYWERGAGARGDRPTRLVLLGLDLQGLGGRGLLAGLVDLDELDLVPGVLLEALDGELALLAGLPRDLGELAVAGAEVHDERRALLALRQLDRDRLAGDLFGLRLGGRGDGLAVDQPVAADAVGVRVRRVGRVDRRLRRDRRLRGGHGERVLAGGA